MSAGEPGLRRDRRQRRERRRRRRVVWAAVAGAAVLLVISGLAVTAALVNQQGSPSDGADDAGAATIDPAAEAIEFPEDEPAATAGAQPCTTATVLSSLENFEMVSRLVAGYNAQPRDIDGRCVTLAATRDKSGLAAEDAAAGFP